MCIKSNTYFVYNDNLNRKRPHTILAFSYFAGDKDELTVTDKKYSINEFVSLFPKIAIFYSVIGLFLINPGNSRLPGFSIFFFRFTAIQN